MTPKGIYIRTKPAWNKGVTLYPELLVRVKELIATVEFKLTLGELFNYIAKEGYLPGSRSGYKTFQRLVSQNINKGLLRDGRGLKNKGNTGEGYGRPQKFQVGDKVRILRANGRTPLWLRENIREDIPRTVTAIIKTGQGSRYHVGCNRIGNDSIEIYTFRSNELIPFVKGKKGRPKIKRVYKYRNSFATRPDINPSTSPSILNLI